MNPTYYLVGYVPLQVDYNYKLHIALVQLHIIYNHKLRSQVGGMRTSC